MVALLDEVAVLLMALASSIAGVVIATRVGGAQRRLALAGSFIAGLPILVVAGFLTVSQG